jgi:hypothetical protein
MSRCHRYLVVDWDFFFPVAPYAGGPQWPLYGWGH